MAHITDLLAPHFTGHVGPVRFVNGHGETDDPDMVAFFAGDPDHYQVTATDETHDGLPFVPGDDELAHLEDDPEDDDPEE